MRKIAFGVVSVSVLILAHTFVIRSWPLALKAIRYPQEDLGLPAPRVYDNPKVTTVEELLPEARKVITREERSHQFPGLSIKGGEKVLMIVDNRTDPLVIEAFQRALREKKCTVDLIVQEKTPYNDLEASMRASVRQAIALDVPKWLEDASKKYDVVFGQEFMNHERRIAAYFGHRLEYTNREKLASPATSYPDELLHAIEVKVWNVIKKAQEVRITDPQGTDVSWTWFDEWWQIIEGIHPTIKIPGITRDRVYRREASAVPMISGHIDVHPRSGMISRANFTGVAVANIVDIGAVPLIKVTYKNNRITNIEGGGAFGRVWRRMLDETKNIKYEYYPEPGTDYMVEISLGTNPKYRGPMTNSGLEGLKRSAGWTWGDSRMASGVLHIAHGTYDAIPWGNETGNPVNHFHLYLYFATYTVKTKDGQTVKLIDNGRLTALDDPEIRRIAAKYGNPDDFLKEDWIPIFNPKTKELEVPPANLAKTNTGN